MIEVTKLDGMTTHLNEDFIGRVEAAVGGQSALYTLDGGHIIVANDPQEVVSLIRAEKVAILRRVLEGPDDATVAQPDAASGLARLSELRPK